MEYKDYFKERAQLYFETSRGNPRPQRHEYECYMRNIPDIPNGLYLHLSGADNQIPYGTQVRVENSTEFAKLADQVYIESYEKTPYEHHMFDVIHSIAGYHHYTPETRRKIHKEMNRILKPNGLYVIADVAEGRGRDYTIKTFLDD